LVIDESSQEISTMKQVAPKNNGQDEEMTAENVLSPIGLPDVRPSTSANARGEETDDGDALSQVGDAEIQPSTSAASQPGVNNKYKNFKKQIMNCV
jgi:hypothetical protein